MEDGAVSIKMFLPAWHAEQETPLHLMMTDIICDKKDMPLINYEAPDGSRRYNS